MFLDGDDVPVGTGGHHFQTLAGDIRPRGFSRITHVTMIIRCGPITAVVFRNGTATVIHVYHLYIVYTGSIQDAGQMLYCVFGKAVADEEDPEGSRHIKSRIRRCRSSSNINSNGVVAGAVAVLLHAQVTHFVGLRINIPDGGSAIVRTHTARGIATVKNDCLVHIAEEDTAAGMVCNHLAVVLQIPVCSGIRQAHDTTDRSVGGRSDVSVILAGRHAGVVGNEADNPAQTGCTGSGHGIELITTILAVVDIRIAVSSPHNARRTTGLGVQVSVVVAGRYGNSFVTTGIRIGKAYDAGHMDGVGIADSIGRIGNVNLSPVVYTVNGNTL